MTNQFYYLTTLDLYQWNGEHNSTEKCGLLTTTRSTLKTIQAKATPEAGLEVRSHVTGVKYKFDYKDFIERADTNLNKGPGFWLYIAEDPRCPIKYIKVEDR